MPTDGANRLINLSEPYVAEVQLKGIADLLFHRWNCEAVAEKAASKKGSKQRKTDDLETFVYRNQSGLLCLPHTYLRSSIVNAAKFRQDPRSTRKSAVDLFKAAIIVTPPLAPLGVKDWDYEHRCRVTIQRSAITRCFPAMRAGWTVTFQVQVNLPEYVDADDLMETVAMAGRLIGFGDFRPTYGRFAVVGFKILTA